MAIKIYCDNCEKSLNAPDAAAGKRMKCPGCGSGIRVPAAGGAENEDGDSPLQVGKVSAKVKDLTKKFSEFTESDRMPRMIAAVKTFGAEAVFQFTRIKTIASASFATITTLGKSAFQNVGIAAFNAYAKATNAFEDMTTRIAGARAKKAMVKAGTFDQAAFDMAMDKIKKYTSY